MTIRVLPPGIVARIAAGEVVERPASIVRELLDNAVDAGASRVEVAVRGDPSSFIRVSDDGCGIPADELALAVSRHATSKLPAGDFGIGAIRTLGFRGEALPSIASAADLRVISRTEGADLAWEISAPFGPDDVRPSGGAKGTRVEVQDIFARVPARLKFLKSRKTELALIREAVDNAALAFPDVMFSFIGGSGRTEHASVGERWDPDAVLARAKAVLGGAYASDGVRIAHEADGISVFGVACVPTRSRRDSGGIRIMVNGRAIHDRGVVSAVRAGYEGLLPSRAVPIAFVHVRVPPSELDVNVHPRKAEVRFLHDDLVRRAVTAAIREALAVAGLRTSSLIASMAASFAATGGEPLGDRRRLPLGRFIGQANESWLVSETMDGLVIVDQHAAHERVLLERLRASARLRASESRRLPSPVTILVGHASAAALADMLDELGHVGLHLAVEGDVATVEAVPIGLDDVDPTVLIEDLAAAATTDPSHDVIGDLMLEAMATAACKSAIKAGRVLSAEEADGLLRDIEATPNASQCNHGRPTIAFLRTEDIERLFGRR